MAKTAGEVPLLPFEMGGEKDEVASFEALAGSLFEDGPDEDGTPKPKNEPAPDDESGESDAEDEEDQDDGSDSEEDAEDESEDEEEDDSDDEDSDESALDLSRKVKTKVNGEEVEITLDEALKGYSRTADYTRKTQEAAEVRKAAVTEREAASAAREQYAKRLQQVEEMLTPQEPDWEAVRKQYPGRFAELFAQHQLRRQEAEAIRAERERVEGEQQEEIVKRTREIITEEQQKLYAAIPEWNDDKVASAEKAAIREFALSRGFTAEQLGRVSDHRLILLLRDAMQFSTLQVKGKELTKKAKPASKTLKAGTPKTPKTSKRRQLTEARKRLARDPSDIDAQVAVFSNFV